MLTIDWADDSKSERGKASERHSLENKQAARQEQLEQLEEAADLRKSIEKTLLYSRNLDSSYILES